MLQGMTTTPTTFQRLMERCMRNMHLKEVLVFLDNLIVFSKTLEEYEARFMKVLGHLKEFGLKLSPEKCAFSRHLSGILNMSSKITSLKTWPVPRICES